MRIIQNKANSRVSVGRVLPFGTWSGDGGGFSPATLFANGERGVWFDPSPDTCFTDAEGTTPASVGDPVALMLDKSGNGYHATQPTAASRPTYGIVPATGRRNLLTWTEDMLQAVWTATGAIVTTNKVVATASNSQHRVDQVSRLVAGRQLLTVDMRSAGCTYAGLRLGLVGAAFDLTNGDIGDLSPGVEAACEAVGDGVWRCSIAIDAGQADTIVRINTATTMDKSNTFIGDGVSGTEVIRAQATNSEYPYQRINSQYDVTEEGVPSLHYLYRDGVDDSLIAALPDLGSDATVAYASDQGVSILTGQTIGAGEFDVLRDQHLYGMVVTDRAWTAEETEGVSEWLNARMPA